MSLLDTAMKSIFSSVVIKILESKNIKDAVNELADKIDEVIDNKFGDKKSERIQETIVNEILLPLNSRLMHEERSHYVSILRQEADKEEKMLLQH